MPFRFKSSSFLQNCINCNDQQTSPPVSSESESDFLYDVKSNDSFDALCTRHRNRTENPILSNNCNQTEGASNPVLADSDLEELAKSKRCPRPDTNRCLDIVLSDSDDCEMVGNETTTTTTASECKLQENESDNNSNPQAANTSNLTIRMDKFLKLLRNRVRTRDRDVGRHAKPHSDELLNKLYNFMKISEIDKYGIRIFEQVFVQCLPYLDEIDLRTMVKSYWCNGSHFKCMMKYRGEQIADEKHLSLKITDELLDDSMHDGASSCKIRSMLLQWREDTCNLRKSIKLERQFFIRNCRLRFWNHEVLVRAYIENGWLTQPLAQIGMNKFSSLVYSKAMRNKLATNFSSSFLHSFFMSHFSLDSIPAMYEEKRGGREESSLESTFNEPTLRRWCELIELLTSRGAIVKSNRFKLLPLNYAAYLGSNTWWLISCSLDEKDKLLPRSISIPDDLWNIMIRFL